jgi:hypothetical protein
MKLATAHQPAGDIGDLQVRAPSENAPPDIVQRRSGYADPDRGGSRQIGSSFGVSCTSSTSGIDYVVSRRGGNGFALAEPKTKAGPG